MRSPTISPRERDAIATIKALGATSGSVFAIYCTQIMLVALFATLIGTALGAALPFVIVWAFGWLIPLPIMSVGACRRADGVDDVWIAHGAGVSPCGRSAALATFPSPCCSATRSPHERNWPRRRYVIMTAVIVAVLAAAAILFAYDRRLAAIFVGAAAVIFLALRLVAMLTWRLARRLPRPRTHAGSRCARQHPSAERPDAERGAFAGSRAFVVGDRDRDRRQSASPIRSGAAGESAIILLHRYSVGRGRTFRCVRARAGAAFVAGTRADAARPHRRCCGIKAEDLKPGEGFRLGAARRPRHHLRDRAAARLAACRGRMVAGRLFRSAARLARSKDRRADLELKLGDTITVNVLGRNITARIANLRAVEWQTSASISSWCFRPVHSPALRTRISRH